MVGASKINNTTDDLERLQILFDMGLSNSEISRTYRTNSGESLSRIHISQIRRGRRWNANTRSFLMKNELEVTDSIKTSLDGVIIKTIISQVITDTQIYHIFVSYYNANVMMNIGCPLMINKPTRNELIEYHLNLVNETISKN